MGFIMKEPEPLPGTHLAPAVCMYCEAPVLALPERASQATCAACGRDEHDAYPPPGIRFPRAELSPKPAATHDEQSLPFTVICEYCEWTGHVATATDAWLALKVHDTVKHDPKGWASGVRGGINDPWGRRR
jgi:hypothetical protein